MEEGKDARPASWDIRDDMASKLGAEKGGEWYWVGDYGDNDYYKLGGQDVSANAVAGSIQHRMIQEGIISTVQGVPVQSGRETRTATFYQKGPNFDTKKDRVQAIVTETWASFSRNPLKYADTVEKYPDKSHLLNKIDKTPKY